MDIKYILLVLTLSAFLSGCAGVSVKQDYDNSTDFSRLKTYAWQPQALKESKNETEDNSLVSDRVVNSVDAVLSGKGYQKNSNGQADFLVDYNYTITKTAESGNGSSVSVGTSFSRGFSFSSIGLGFANRSQNEEIEKLSVDVLNPLTGKLIWRGFVEKEFVRSSDPNKSAESIKRSVKAILSKFPPKR